MRPNHLAALLAVTFSLLPLTACPLTGVPGSQPSPGSSPAVNPGTSGSLDTSFGDKGVATSEITPGADDIAYGVAVQADGKIVLAGTTGKAQFTKTGLARFTIAGAADTTFGTQGAATSLKDVSNSPYGLAIQSDGKIVTGGWKNTSATTGATDFLVTRHTASGALDTAFGSGGFASLGVSYAYGQTLAIQPDGRIVVVGRGGTLIDDDAIVARFTPAGALDTSFAGDGTANIDWATAYDDAVAVALQSDGKIVVVGKTNVHNVVLCRVTATGTVDSSFGTSGVVKRDLGTGNQARKVAIQADGKIVVAGGARVHRYLASGAVDTTFGTEGTVSLDGFQLNALEVLSDGRILVAGKDAKSVAVVRLTTAGGLDTGFGSGGKVSLEGAVPSGEAYDLAVQADGKILVAGKTFSQGDDDFLVLRLWP